MSIGGSIESVSIDGQVFAVAADSDASRKLGGFENEIQMNGNGTGRAVKTRVPWSLSGISVDIDDLEADAEFLQDLADSNKMVPISITFASGSVYQGMGTVTGEVSVSSQSTTAEIELSGPNKLTPQ